MIAVTIILSLLKSHALSTCERNLSLLDQRALPPPPSSVHDTAGITELTRKQHGCGVAFSKKTCSGIRCVFPLGFIDMCSLILAPFIFCLLLYVLVCLGFKENDRTTRLCPCLTSSGKIIEIRNLKEQFKKVASEILLFSILRIHEIILVHVTIFIGYFFYVSLLRRFSWCFK
jgi:hypothetical protein